MCIEPVAHHVAAAHGLGKASYRSTWHCLGEVHMHRLLKATIGDSIQTVTHESACCMHANQMQTHWYWEKMKSVLLHAGGSRNTSQVLSKYVHHASQGTCTTYQLVAARFTPDTYRNASKHENGDGNKIATVKIA